MSKITLTPLVNLQNETTAVTVINNNSSTLQTAIDNTLSRDGTSPNQMSSAIDMNSNRLLNLPAPISSGEPLRLQDANTLNGGGTIQSIPSGGTTGQSLQKNSNSNYDVKWGSNVTSVGLALPADFTITNSPVTSTGTLTGSWATPPTGTGAVVRTTSPTLVTPVFSSIVNTGTLSLPSSSDTLVGRATTDTLTNKTLTTPVINGLVTGTSIALSATPNTLVLRDSNGNITNNNVIPTYTTTATAGGTTTLTVNSSYWQAFTGATTQTVVLPVTSTLVLGQSFVIDNNSTGTITVQSSGTNPVGIIPSLCHAIITCQLTSGTTAASWNFAFIGIQSLGQIPGTVTNDNANAGNIGEVISSNVNSASAISLTTGTAANITSIVLTPGEWDIYAQGGFIPAATTSVTGFVSSISTTTGTLDVSTPFAWNQFSTAAEVPGGLASVFIEGPVRAQLTSNTTYFLVNRAAFTVSTLTSFGGIRARRIR